MTTHCKQCDDVNDVADGEPWACRHCGHEHEAMTTDKLEELARECAAVYEEYIPARHRAEFEDHIRWHLRRATESQEAQLAEAREEKRIAIENRRVVIDKLEADLQLLKKAGDQLAACHVLINEMHKAEQAHNERDLSGGMPVGPCQCKICKALTAWAEATKERA